MQKNQDRVISIVALIALVPITIAGYLYFQKYGHTGLNVYLGGIATLALKTNAVVIPTCAIWDAKRGKYFFHGDPPVELVRTGEFIIVPRGVEHLPIADEETHILLFEPKSTLNTGNVVNERTVAELERL